MRRTSSVKTRRRRACVSRVPWPCCALSPFLRRSIPRSHRPRRAASCYPEMAGAITSPHRTSGNLPQLPRSLGMLDHALQGEIMFKHILIPFDGSPLSFRPVATAIEMAKAQQGKLTLLSVAEPRLFNGADAEARYGGAVADQHNALGTSRTSHGTPCNRPSVAVPSKAVLNPARERVPATTRSTSWRRT